jgi:hypothetical protein
MNTKENQRSELCFTLLSKTSNSECGLTGVHTECLQIPQYATHLRVEGGLGMVLQISSLMILSSKSTQMIFLCLVPAPHSAEHCIERKENMNPGDLQVSRSAITLSSRDVRKEAN